MVLLVWMENDKIYIVNLGYAPPNLLELLHAININNRQVAPKMLIKYAMLFI